jgi:hypothetical protein
MVSETIGSTAGRRGACSGGTADLLRFAAAPTFAGMALLSSMLGRGSPDALCSTVNGASPLTGMVAMYVLMSIFHAAPWLKLISTARNPSTSPKGEAR